MRPVFDLGPIAAWEERYVYEEPIHSEASLLRDLRLSVGSAEVVQRHISDIVQFVDALPSAIADLYRPWALSADSYKFGGEAHLQKRILHLLHCLHAAGFPVADIGESIWARQTIVPSGFNATPRISRFHGYSYIIFPAPTTYWLYSICEFLADVTLGININDRKLSLYLRYLIAARSFERFANVVSAINLDKLVDEIVHRGDVEDVDRYSSPPSSLLLNMIGAAEDFIVCHEIAHLVLKHGSDGSIAAEAAADRLALTMLRSVAPANFGYFPTAGLEARHLPQLGYLTLRFWTEVRLAAEQRVLPYVWDTPEQVARQVAAIHRVRDLRSRQMQEVGILDQFEVSDVIRRLCEGFGSLVDQVVSQPLDNKEVDRMRTLAKTLAAEDYDELRRRYGVDMAKPSG